MKSPLLTYIGLLEVDEAAFQSLVDVLRKNRYLKFFFSQISFISLHRTCRTRLSCVFKERNFLSKNRYVEFFFAETNFFNAPEPPTS